MQIEVVLNNKNIVLNVEPSQRIFPHFTISEMANPSAKETTKLIITQKVIKHGKMLEALRVKMKRSFTVNSWFRTKSFNKQVGGIDSSNHCKGTATDIAFSDAEKIFDDVAAEWQMICESSGIVGEAILYKKSKFIHLGSFVDYQTTFYKAVKNQ